MEVNWLTVLNTVSKQGRNESERAFTAKALFLGLVCVILFFLLVRCLSCRDAAPAISKPRISRLSSSHQDFYSFPSSAMAFLSYSIFCPVPGFIPQQWGWKLHFSWNVSCRKVPAGVIFYAEVKKKNIRLHLLHFMYVNQNTFIGPARWCV